MEITRDIIPEGNVNRPGARNSCRYITVHETANAKRGADACAHAGYVKKLRERTSWHYTVDDHSVYQHLPDEEKSYHTSSATANENSIAIELCVNADGDFRKTVDNAVWLVRQLMKKHGISAEYIRTHKEWTGKQCPATLLSGGWKEFVTRISAEEKKSITVSELRAMGYSEIKL